MLKISVSGYANPLEMMRIVSLGAAEKVHAFLRENGVPDARLDSITSSPHFVLYERVVVPVISEPDEASEVERFDTEDGPYTVSGPVLETEEGDEQAAPSVPSTRSSLRILAVIGMGRSNSFSSEMFDVAVLPELANTDVLFKLALNVLDKTFSKKVMVFSVITALHNPHADLLKKLGFTGLILPSGETNLKGWRLGKDTFLDKFQSLSVEVSDGETTSRIY